METTTVNAFFETRKAERPMHIVWNQRQGQHLRGYSLQGRDLWSGYLGPSYTVSSAARGR
jgi:hypothetical protein